MSPHARGRDNRAHNQSATMRSASGLVLVLMGLALVTLDVPLKMDTDMVPVVYVARGDAAWGVSKGCGALS